MLDLLICLSLQSYFWKLRSALQPPCNHPPKKPCLVMASTAAFSSLLSLLYLALLTFVGSAVLLAEMHHQSLPSLTVHAFLALLMSSSCLWMLWFVWHSMNNKQLKMHQDHQAGATWLKGRDATKSICKQLIPSSPKFQRLVLNSLVLPTLVILVNGKLEK